MSALDRAVRLQAGNLDVLIAVLDDGSPLDVGGGDLAVAVVDHRLSHVFGFDRAVRVRHIDGHAGRDGDQEVGLEVAPFEIAPVCGDGNGPVAFATDRMELVGYLPGRFLIPPPDPLLKDESNPVGL